MKHLFFIIYSTLFIGGILAYFLGYILYIKYRSYALKNYLYAFSIFVFVLILAAISIYININIGENTLTEKVFNFIIMSVQNIYFYFFSLLLLSVFNYKINSKIKTKIVVLTLLLICISIVSGLGEENILLNRKSARVILLITDFILISFFTYLLIDRKRTFSRIDDSRIKSIVLKGFYFFFVLYILFWINDLIALYHEKYNFIFYLFIFPALLMIWLISHIRHCFKYYSKKIPSLENIKIEPSFICNFGITKREEEIIMCILKGYSNREIADKLILNIGTIKGYVYSIFQKTSVKNRVSLVKLVLKNVG